MKTRHLPHHWILIAGAAAVLAACGGGGSGGGEAPAPTPVVPTSLNQVVAGTVSGFGSVFVDGVKYDDSAASVKVEDDSASPRDAALSSVKLGMRLELQTDDANKARALKISPELLGKIASLSSDGFTVAGQSVKISTVASDTTPVTVFEGVSGLAGLAANDFVEVHGTRDAAGTIIATRVERKDPAAAAAIRVTGTVSAYNSTDKSFTLGGLVVKMDGSTRMNPAGVVITNGQRVAVWSDTAIVGNQLTAKSVSVRASGLANNDKAKLGGLISDLNFAAKTFKIDGVDVDASAAGLQVENGTLADLANGRRVRVSGTFSASRVSATEIKFVRNQGDAMVELTGIVTDFVSSSSFKVRGVPIDASGSGITFRNGTATNLANGVLVKIQGNASSVVVPTELEFVTAADGRAVGFAGMLTDLSATGFKLNGVEVRIVPGSTKFELNDAPATIAALVNGKFVKVKGAFSGTAFVASEVEVQDGGPGAGLRDVEGIVSDVADVSGGRTFMLNGTKVRVATGTPVEGGTLAGLANGTKVEVYGPLVSGEIVANKVEIKPAEGAGTVRIRGAITDFVSSSDFRVAGQKVNATGKPGLANGVLVELEGTIASGVLNVTNLKIKD